MPAFKIELTDILSNPVDAIFITEKSCSIRLKKDTPQSVRDCILNKFLALKESNQLMDTRYNKENFCIEFVKRPGEVNISDLEAIKNILTSPLKNEDQTLNENFNLVNISSFPEANEYINKSLINDKLKTQLEEQINNIKLGININNSQHIR